MLFKKILDTVTGLKWCDELFKEIIRVFQKVKNGSMLNHCRIKQMWRKFFFTKKCFFKYIYPKNQLRQFLTEYVLHNRFSKFRLFHLWAILGANVEGNIN